MSTDIFTPCYQCGDPARYIAPDAYGPREIGPEHYLCTPCAEQWRDIDGERIEPLGDL